MEELHTDSIDGGHEASYGARSRARERAYSNINARFPYPSKKEAKLFHPLRDANTRSSNIYR
jgi:hypothetical protein